MAAPTLMRMAIPAITANAANRLPLTPHRGRRKLTNPLFNRTAMPPAPQKASGKHSQQYRGTRLTKSRSFRSFGEFDAFPNRRGRCEAGLCWIFLQTEAVPSNAAVELMLHAFINDVLIIAEAAVVNVLPLHVYDLVHRHRVMV